MVSMTEKKTSKLTIALAELKNEETIAIVKQELEANEKPTTIIEELREGLDIIGKRFEEGRYFLSELVFGGELFKRTFEMIKPRLASTLQPKFIGKFVIGTAQGDIHDLGKNIVAMMLEYNGFEVYDLGVDVPPEKFVKKAEEANADLVGISGLLTTSIESMRKTINLFERSGIRPKIKIIIGGGVIDEYIMKKVGANAYAGDAVSAVKIAKEMLSPQPRNI